MLYFKPAQLLMTDRFLFIAGSITLGMSMWKRNTAIFNSKRKCCCYATNFYRCNEITFFNSYSLSTK